MSHHYTATATGVGSRRSMSSDNSYLYSSAANPPPVSAIHSSVTSTTSSSSSSSTSFSPAVASLATCQAAFKAHLVDTTVAQVTALLRHGWIDRQSYDTILTLLPASDTAQTAPGAAAAPPKDLRVSALRSTSTSPQPPVIVSPSPAADARKSRRVSGVGTLTATFAQDLVQAQAPAPVYRVAIRDFVSDVEGDLNFRVGDVIEIIEEVDENWLSGMLFGKMGIFPKNMTEPKASPPRLPRRATKSTSPGRTTTSPNRTPPRRH